MLGAVTETVDVQILNALKQLGHVCEQAYGKDRNLIATVEFSITIQGIKSTQKGK